MTSRHRSACLQRLWCCTYDVGVGGWGFVTAQCLHPAGCPRLRLSARGVERLDYMQRLQCSPSPPRRNSLCFTAVSSLAVASQESGPGAQLQLSCNILRDPHACRSPHATYLLRKGLDTALPDTTIRSEVFRPRISTMGSPIFDDSLSHVGAGLFGGRSYHQDAACTPLYRGTMLSRNTRPPRITIWP